MRNFKNIFRYINNSVTIIVLIVLLFMLVMIPLDAFEFWTNPEQYIYVYHLDTAKPNWKLDYIQSHLIAIPIALLLIGMIVHSYKRPKNTALSILKTFCVWLIIGIFICYFYSWAKTGYDH